MHKVLGGLGEKGFKLRGYQHIVIITQKKKKKLIYVSKNEPINVPQNCRIYKTHRVNALRQIPNTWYKFKALKTDSA